MKETTASSFFEINVACPYCNAYEDVTDDLKELLDYDLRTSGIEKEITCSECRETYIVTEVTY